MPLFDRRFQRLAVDEAHCIARLAALALDHAVDRHDTEVFQLGGNLGLQFDATARIRIAGPLSFNALEGDIAVKLLIAAQQDFPEAALLPRADHRDVAEPRERCRGRRSRRDSGYQIGRCWVGRCQIAGLAGAGRLELFVATFWWWRPIRRHGHGFPSSSFTSFWKSLRKPVAQPRRAGTMPRYFFCSSSFFHFAASSGLPQES